ncbi:dipeptidase [Steroidobacter cummioxidans]|uniref:dipeptidase n=1 Tax=Steroidobacter cummioxidans TaxID=1803913 RepID=UPI000E3105E2|nr:membrane dipeptidase [Steroidobacter cummioxidans]
MSSRRRILKSLLAVGGLSLGAPFINRGRCQAFAGSSITYSTRAIDLVNDSLLIDMLSLLSLEKVFTAATTGGNALLFDRAELLALKESGIDVFHPATGISGATAHAGVLAYMAACNGLVAEFPDLLIRVDSAADLERVRSEGRLGLIPGVQNSEHFRNTEDVERFHQLGQRVSQLTYNAQNLIGSGGTERVDGGISDFGAGIVAAMNEVGMAVDVSHCGDRTTLDAFELSTQPVLITHSNCRALVPGHPRCKTDEAIKAMARRGGVMGIAALRNFVSAREPVTLDDYIDHIDHVVSVAGIEHVGIGSDMDLHGYDALPAPLLEWLKGRNKSSYGFRDRVDIPGLDHPKKMFDLVEGLIRRGYSDAQIRAVLGGNFRRVLGEIWRG